MIFFHYNIILHWRWCGIHNSLHA